ncbi:MAG: GNAT family N-acetyltransferase [Desulfobacterales bacterium]|nr:GNAT family N-acetyltransferase [Desulfobacterales bacterium]
MARDENDKVVGGAIAQIIWNWFYVSHLWVHSGLRSRGLGREIMNRLNMLLVKEVVKKITLKHLVSKKNHSMNLLITKFLLS